MGLIDTWFISDTHFGHKNILEYEPVARPFSCLEEMHEVMIDRWNSVVKSKDIVYHLGDFCFGRHNIRIAERLNGKKKLIMGNHDTYPTVEYLEYFDKLYGVVFYERCILSHCPVHPHGLGSRWIMNVHGHLHSKFVADQDKFIWTKDDNFPDQKLLTSTPDINYFNVSCEQNNLTPIHKDVIMDRLKEIDL